jgi:hypothetical protein
MQPMAKARECTTVADSKPQSTPNDWMPLDDAFQHIQQVAGGEQLAEEELRLRLESGDVEAQERRVTPGEGIETIPLTPEDFKDGLLFPRLLKLDGDINFLSLLHEAHRRDNLLRRIDRYRSDGRNFFLRRADVYRIWPIAGGAKKPRKAALPTTRPKGTGPKVWLAINEVWELYAGGYRWPDREAVLRKVRVATGDLGLSPRTLDKALAHLRQKRLIDR